MPNWRGVDSVRLSEVGALLATFLPDATEEEKARLIEYQDDMRMHQVRWAQMLNQEIIGSNDYINAVNREFFCAFKKSERLLGGETISRIVWRRFFDRCETRRNAIARNTRIFRSLIPAYSRNGRAKFPGECGVFTQPQDYTKIGDIPWAPNGRYQDLSKKIMEAEGAYCNGSISKSIDFAREVILDVTRYERVTDTPFYLASWAYHIIGRAYEARSDWRSASDNYGASLNLKMKMQNWLPPLLRFTTEVKLVSAELFDSEKLSAFASASRVSNVISCMKAEENKLQQSSFRLFHNLLADCYVLHAEALYKTHDTAPARESAEKALKLAFKLKDVVGQIRALFIMYNLTERKEIDFLMDIRRLVQDMTATSLQTHPAVTQILATLELEAPICS